MKKLTLLLTICLLCFSFKSFSQTPGILDQSFGTDGVVIINYSGQDVYALDIGFQSDGNMIIGGTMASNIWASRMDEDGIINSGFGNYAGYFVHDFGSVSYGRALAVLPDDKILLVGEVYSQVFVMRLTPDGQLDTSFGEGNGFFLYSEMNAVKDIKAYTSGASTYFYLSGYSGTFSDQHPAMLKIDQDGFLISSFGTNGAMVWDDIDGSIQDIDIDISLDKIYGIGKYNNEAMIFRCYHNGQIDPTFGISGNVIFEEPANGEDLELRTCIVDQENHYITCFGFMDDPGGGGTSSDICALRVNSGGAMNLNFGVNGWSYMQLFGPDYIYDAVQQSDAKFYFAGRTEFYTSTQDFFLGRMGPFGFLDPVFGTSGVTFLDYANNNEYALKLLLDEINGKLIVLGISYGSDYVSAMVARYHTGYILNTPEIPKHEIIEIYPNPANASIRLDIKGAEKKNIRLQLVNSIGIVVQSWDENQFTNDGNSIELKIPSSLVAGTYILLAYIDNKEVRQQKLLITNRNGHP